MNCRTKSSILPFVVILWDSARIFFLCSASFGISVHCDLSQTRLPRAARLLDDHASAPLTSVSRFDMRPVRSLMVALVRSEA